MMKRPEIDDKIILNAARTVAAELNGNAELIAKHYTYGMNGYELAKELERSELWDIDALIVDQLDCMDCEVDQEHEKVCKKWIKDNNIQPPLKIGTKIKEGTITGIDQYGAARYLVKENGCTQKGRSLLIRFEDAVQV